MPSKPTTRPYAIYRSDNSYLVYDLTKADYEEITEAWQGNMPFAKTSVGLIGLSDVRSVIMLKDQPTKQPEKEKPANPPLSMVEQAWLNQYKHQDEDKEVYS